MRARAWVPSWLAAAWVLGLTVVGCGGTAATNDDAGGTADASSFDATALDGERPDTGSADDGGSSDATSSDDAGNSSDALLGEACGSVTCPLGEVCCNRSCGLCTPPGGSCIELACTDGGTGDDAGPTSDAGGSLSTCGGRAGACRSPAEFCEFEPSALCGRADGTGVCRARPTECGPGGRAVCGCDDVNYASECLANRAGVSVSASGACGAPVDCRPMQARGEGLCDLFLGYAWSGTACVGLSGCSCAGADCGALYTEMTACISAHAGC